MALTNTDAIARFPTPYFIVDRKLLLRNLAILQGVQQDSGCRILLALKGFAMHCCFPDLAGVLQGTCASSPHEARLGREAFGGEVHSFAAAYSDADFAELLGLSNHIVFNSLSQYSHFFPLIEQHAATIRFGLRINPEHSETDTALYDPCAPHSRLGITRQHFPKKLPEHISGLHFHTLCEKNADSLERTLAAAEAKFGEFFKACRWVNFGGGHHITREDYDLELLIRLIRNFKATYDVDVFLEPGEAVALDTGFLVCTVLDVIDNGMPIAILDMSVCAHTPDVLEMPYRPHIIGSGKAGQKTHTFRLAGLSCLAGDVVGDYSFDAPLTKGSKIIFTDMAHYSMVKTNTFNGIRLPDIYYYDSDADAVLHHRAFGYEDFSMRLA